LERGIAVRQGFRFLRSELPSILARRSDALSPRMMRAIEDLASDWRRLDERIEGLSADITSLVEQVRRTAGPYIRVTKRRTQREQILSAVPS
jgi:hypothetical protein